MIFDVSNEEELKALTEYKVVGFDQLFRNPPSKPSNIQVDEGLF